MGVAYELKQKRADIRELMNALDRVILSYGPDYQGRR